MEPAAVPDSLAVSNMKFLCLIRRKKMSVFRVCRVVLFLTFLAGAVFQNGGFIQDARAAEQAITLAFDKAGSLPAGFRAETTGSARYTAVWEVVPDSQAPSPPNVLRITSIKAPSGGQFNLCWSKGITFRNGTIEVMVRADSGHIDQGGGPVWRVIDRKNYYVARLNPLEDNFRLYYVKRGRRVMLASADVQGIRQGMWFSLRITVDGDHITGWVNGQRLIDVRDSTFPGSGGVGLWTKADAASSFDNMVIRPR